MRATLCGGEVGGENGVCLCRSLSGDVRFLVIEQVDCFDDHKVTHYDGCDRLPIFLASLCK